MSSGGGRDRSDYENFNPDQYLDDDNPNKAQGCHKGSFAGLNIVNAQPETFYGWGNNTRKGVLEARIKGYRVISGDDPERAGSDHILGFDHQDLDSSNTQFPGVVMMKRTARDERRVREEEKTRNESLLRGGTAESGYKAKATALEVQSGGRRFQREDHRTYTTGTSDPDGPVADAWIPDHGNSG